MELPILLVDDRMENIVALEKVLSNLGAEFYRATSGNEALALTLDHDFALALVDVQMPEMDGYETVELMRQEARTEYLPVIFVSAIYSENYHLIRGVESGAVDFVTKPIVPKILKGKVKIFLDLHRQRKELVYREKQFRTLYNKTPIMLHSIDQNGVLVSVSDFWCEKLGYSKEEVIGKRSIDFLTKESQSRAINVHIPGFMKMGAMYDVPYSFVCKDGSIVEVLMSAISENDADGRFIRSMAVSVDVTEKNRADEKLKRYAKETKRHNDEMKQYSTILSHDLRVPLTNVQGFVDVLKADVECEKCPREQISESLEYIETSVESMTQLINKLSDINKAGGRELKIEKIDLNESIKKAWDTLKQWADEGRVKMKLNELPFVDADALGLYQIFSNLLKNAIVYRSEDRDSFIEVSSIKSEEGVEVLVRDNGIGMDDKIRGLIFQPFRRGEGNNAKGEGLGLSYVQAIIRAHGGMIWVDSEKDVGSTFHFTIPNA